jgi:hypothetical protein
LRQSAVVEDNLENDFDKLEIKTTLLEFADELKKIENSLETIAGETWSDSRVIRQFRKVLRRTFPTHPAVTTFSRQLLKELKTLEWNQFREQVEDFEDDNPDLLTTHADAMSANKKHQKKGRNNGKCFHCGERWDKNHCKGIGKECYICHKIGHLSKVRKSKQKKDAMLALYNPHPHSQLGDEIEDDDLEISQELQKYYEELYSFKAAANEEWDISSEYLEISPELQAYYDQLYTLRAEYDDLQLENGFEDQFEAKEVLNIEPNFECHQESNRVDEAFVSERCVNAWSCVYYSSIG